MVILFSLIDPLLNLELCFKHLLRTKGCLIYYNFTLNIKFHIRKTNRYTEYTSIESKTIAA
jgi:hypothetical protein